MLHQLYIRGRHSSISVITGTQKFNALATVRRNHATELYVYRLRNHQDLESFIDDVSAGFDEKILLDISYGDQTAILIAILRFDSKSHNSKVLKEKLYNIL